MKKEWSHIRDNKTDSHWSERGFTLIEFMLASAIMLVVILGALSIYMESNKIAVDQQQFTEIQHDARAAMFFIARDLKSLGAGLPGEFGGYYLQGVNNDPNQGGLDFQSDRLTILGNADPLRLLIQSYTPGTGTINIEPNEFIHYPYMDTAYPSDPAGYINRMILILPNPGQNFINAELGQITSVDLMGNQITFNTLNIPLPNDLQPGGVEGDYVAGTVHFVDVKTYWLDIDGNYPGLTAGTNGYIGEPNVLYVGRLNHSTGIFEHQALARNIEDLQFQYHGNLDGDDLLDDNNGNGLIDNGDFLNWDDLRMWTDEPTVVIGIRRIRLFVLARTENAYVSVSGTPDVSMQYIYGKPPIADSPAGAQPDRHRRFLLDSTSNLRNMSLGVYNDSTYEGF